MLRRLAWLAVGALTIAIVVSACSVSVGGDDESDDSAPTATEASQPDLEDGTPTATEAPAPTDEPQATATATGTPEPTVTSTATATSTPEPTLTPTPSATPTATPIPIVENPFANAPAADAVLENYTVEYSGTFETPEDGIETIELFIEQSDPTHYHLRAGAEVEIWVIDTTTYFRNPDDGSIFPIPAAVDAGLVSPAAYLIQVPNPANVPQALAVGEDDIDGRPATHYSVTAEQIEQLGLADDQQITDPEGDFDVWIDQELGFISQMAIDAEWTDEAGVRQSAVLDLVITRVNTTPEIVAPV